MSVLRQPVVKEYALYESMPAGRGLVGLKAETVTRLKALQQSYEQLSRNLAAQGLQSHFDLGGVEIRSRERVFFADEGTFETVRFHPEEHGMVRFYLQGQPHHAYSFNLARPPAKLVEVTRASAFNLAEGAKIEESDYLVKDGGQKSSPVPTEWVGHAHSKVVHGRVRRAPPPIVRERSN